MLHAPLAVGIKCEICGREIRGRPYLIEVDGAVLRVCSECAKLGKPYKPASRSSLRITPKPLSVNRHRRTSLPEDLILDPGYPAIVRRAREKLGLTQEELAGKIGEKTSVISKIESGKLRPTIPMARKIEHALKIRIVKTVEELEVE